MSDSYSWAYSWMEGVAELLPLPMGSCLCERYTMTNPGHLGAQQQGWDPCVQHDDASAGSEPSGCPSDCGAPLGGFWHMGRRHWAAEV